MRTKTTKAAQCLLPSGCCCRCRMVRKGYLKSRLPDRLRCSEFWAEGDAQTRLELLLATCSLLRVPPVVLDSCLLTALAVNFGGPWITCMSHVKPNASSELRRLLRKQSTWNACWPLPSMRPGSFPYFFQAEPPRIWTLGWFYRSHVKWNFTCPMDKVASCLSRHLRFPVLALPLAQPSSSVSTGTH